MAKHLLYRQGLCAGVLLVAVGSLVAYYPLQSQTGVTTQEDLQKKALQYEVISIKLHKAGNIEWSFRPDGFNDSGITLEPLITYAYDIDENQVSGLPGWVSSNYYDIQARVDARTAEAWKKLSPKEVSAQQQLMFRSLLADRCQLKAHLETREHAVYDLVIAKGGLKMKEAPPNEKHGGEVLDGEVKGHSTSMKLLVANLSGPSGRMVVDKTGLGDKRFDFDLKWMPDSRRDADPAGAGASLFTALQEQLGLKLVPAKGPVQILVIDHMEKPSAN